MADEKVAELEKVRENRLRRTAERRGYEARKSRRRDPKARDFGKWWIAESEDGAVVAGGKWGISIEQAEEWLDGDR